MNYTRWIAGRMLRTPGRRQVSRPIVRIATGGIAIGMALMMLSMAVVKGFQKEIRDKVVGFGSHFQVTGNESNAVRESQRILYEADVVNSLQAVEGVTHVQVFASKPGILETKDALQGVVIKGVGDDYDWTFFRNKMTEGTVLSQDTGHAGVMISGNISRRMKLSVGDKLSLYFINNDYDARQRNFTVDGIYETGLEDFDDKYVIIPISYIQRLSGWGIEVQLYSDSVCRNGQVLVEALVTGGTEHYSYIWNTGWSGEGPHSFPAGRDTVISVVVKDDSDTMADTASLKYHFEKADPSGNCVFTIVRSGSGGSWKHYIGGYEVSIEKYDQLLSSDDAIHHALPFYLGAQNVTDRSPEIFSWLGLLDINVTIIIFLMVAISIVNMTSALLILILERQGMIGTLKAFGSTNGPILRIFLIQAFYIIAKGILLGNLLGLGIAFLQAKTGLFTLDPENYFVDKVPIHFDWNDLLLLNAGTLVTCLLFLSLPALYVTTITPIKAIRFS